jgi:hypothetical protein
MTETNSAELINLARQGNLGAITHLLNSALTNKGIITKINCQQEQLTIFADADEIPDSSSLVGVIQKGIKDLQLDTIASIKIYGRKIGEPSTGWREEVILKPDLVAKKQLSTKLTKSSNAPEDVLAQFRPSFEQLLKRIKTIRIGKRTIITAISFVFLVLLAWGGVLGFKLFQLRSTQAKTINQAQALMAEAADPTKAADPNSLKTGATKLNEAIALLKGIEDRPGSLHSQAQSELQKGRTQLEVIEQRLVSATSVSESLISIDQSAQEAISLLQNAPHPLEKWKQAKLQLEQAIKQLEQLPQDSHAATEIQNKLSVYRKNSVDLMKFLTYEEKATRILQSAESKALEAMASTEGKTEYALLDLQKSQDLWWKAISLLKTVPKQSAAYQQVSDSAPVYIENYKELSSSIQEMQKCLKQGSSTCGYAYLSLKTPSTTTSNSGDQSTQRDPFSKVSNYLSLD